MLTDAFWSFIGRDKGALEVVDIVLLTLFVGFLHGDHTRRGLERGWCEEGKPMKRKQMDRD